MKKTITIYRKSSVLGGGVWLIVPNTEIEIIDDSIKHDADNGIVTLSIKCDDLKTGLLMKPNHTPRPSTNIDSIQFDYTKYVVEDDKI